MTGPRCEARESQSSHPLVDRGQLQRDLDLLGEDASRVPPAERADAAVGVRGAGQHPRLERGLLRGRQRRRVPFGLASRQPGEPEPAVATDPLVDELPRPPDPRRDLLAGEFRAAAAAVRVVPGDRQQHRPQSVPLDRQRLGGDPPPEFAHVTRVVRLRLQAGLPVRGGRILAELSEKREGAARENQAEGV